MAREFSFEEAIAPPAKASAPKEFSFEEAVGAKPTPKAKAKPVTEEAGYDFGAAMAADLALPEIPEKKVYTGSVFDTQPFEPEFNKAEADRLSRRAYAEASTKPARRTQYVQATPKEQLERSAGQAVLDTTIGLLQGAVGIPKGIAENINAGDNAVAKFYKSATEAGERAKSPYLQSQKAEREAFLKNVLSNQGELAETRASFTSMFSPAGADVVAQGAGSLIPTFGISLLGLGQKSMVAMNALSNAGSSAQSAAEKLSQMSPEDWSKSSAYQDLRQTGMSHRDAVSMLTPLFALPAQFVGGIIGIASGTTGLEARLAGKATKGLRASLGRAGTEFVGEEAESVIPSFVGNITQRLIDEKKSLTEGLGREAVETAFGAAPGAALAAIPPARRQRMDQYVRDRGYEGLSEYIARSKGFLGGPKKSIEQLIAELDALVQREQGEQDVGQTITEPSGEGVSMADESGRREPTGGLGFLEPDGMVSTGQDATGAVAGEGTEPTAVEAAPAALTKGQQKLRETLDSNGRIFIDDREEAGKKTYYAKGVGSISADFQVELQLTPEEKRAAILAEADIALADTQEERNAGKKALEDALRPAADRATRTPIKTTGADVGTTTTKATPEKSTTLYHGTNTQYKTLDPEKSGGMVFFGEDLPTAQRYAQNGGGGRARLDNTQKYIVTDRGVVYELDGETWNAVGIAPEDGLINQDTIQSLDKAYSSLSQAEAENITNPDSGTAGVVPKTSRIITQDFSGLKLLDISTPEGRDVIAKLTPSTQVGSGLVDAARFDARDKTDRNSTTQLNSNFWSLTKYSSAYGEQLKKDIIAPLKAMGYDGIRFQDDQHSSVGLFDTGLSKTKPTTKTKGANVGTETTETKQAETQGQETAPAADVDPLDKYFTPDSALHKFYKTLPEYSKGKGPDNPYRIAQYALLDVKDGIRLLTERLQATGHPSVTAETWTKRAYAKSIATPDIKFLHQTISQLAGLGYRIANQGMAIAKQYKGKKAISLETLNKSVAELNTDLEKVANNLYLYGFLTPEEAAFYEKDKGLTPKPPAAPAETPAAPAETAEDTTPSVDELFPPPKGVVPADADVPEGALDFPVGKTVQKAPAPPTEAETEAAEEAAEEAIRNKAEAEIDEGPIGQAIAKIENGDIETKAQIRSLVNKLERDSVLDDVEDVREGLSDREQDASDVLDTLSGLLDDARDTAIDERTDELLEERAQEATASKTPTPPAEPVPYYGSNEIDALSKNIIDVVESIANDFMVGDMVKFGNISGVVVGKEGDYVRMRPDGAKSPKAYQRLPKKSLTFIARPDTTSTSAASKSADQDKKFGSEQGALNADMAGLIQVFGAGMYAAAIVEVSVKELLQNSFDAVKGAISGKKSKSLYKIGKVSIELNGNDRTITVTDNARGMTPEIVRNAFFTVAGTDKSDLDPEDRSGGLGLAKMGFMMGAKRIVLNTVRDGVRIQVDATAKEIAGSKFKIIKSPAPKDEHGTTVTVEVPEYYIDPKNGEQRYIYFSNDPKNYDALKQPLIGPAEVEVTSIDYNGKATVVLPIGINFDASEYQQFKVNFSWGSADVYFGKERKKEAYYAKHQVLSSGVYQFNTTFKLGQEKIPYDLIVNIKSSVPAQHPDYPFENSRERFKMSLEKDIGALSEYLARIALGNEAQDLQDNFKNIVSMPRMDVGQDIADVSNKLHKAFDNRGITTKRMELPPMPAEVSVVGTTVIQTDTGKILADAGKEKEKKKEASFKAEQAAPDMKDFMLKMAQNPSQPIFHNNTNVNYIEIGKQYGNPEVFFAELGTLMVEMKEALADSGFYGYDVLKAGNLFFGGISIDKGYGGVHIKVPYKAVLLNPFYDFGAKTLFGAAEFMWETMTHEVAHTGAMNHGEAHNTHMLKVRQYLADEGLRAYFYDAITDILRRHESTFTAMREAYGRSTTANTGKSLDKYGDSATSVQVGNIRSSGPDELGTVPTGGRRGGDGDIRAASEIDSTVGFRREGSPESVKGLHQDVVNAINNNDINGALKALSRNTSGLYSELASRLAELNLPTSITFGQTADLLHRSMNITVGQQQIRLFAYLSRQYPDLYNKHFKNYDRSENLEKVYAGLQALEKGKYNLDPIIVEFREVSSTFNRNMKGLKTPGMYIPNLDTVSISPNKIFGSSNQVLLHEIVHAATEYMLRESIPNATARQYQAVSNLYKMYKDAQDQLPPGDYGFTNIFEFVAEVMTNPNFQKKLSGVYYRTEKASLLNSMYRYIMSAVGLGNLAGAAMKEVNEIMSAYRPAGAVNAPLRFAKRIRGPISTPDTYRTAESVQKGIQYRLAEATAGRMTMGEAIGDLKDSLWEASGYAARATVLPFLQLRQLSELTRTRFPQIDGAIRIVMAMVSYRGKKIKIAEDIIQLWNTAQGANPTQSKLMSRIMIEATIRGIDPDTAQAGALNKPLADAWKALDPEFKTIYRKVRDFYADSVKEMINDMKLKARAITDPIQRQKVLDKIDEQFGPDKLASPYFPLRRFGNFWFQIGSGNFKEFYTFENPVSRELAFRARRRELENGNAQQRALAKTIFKGNGISELYGRNVATTQVLRDVQDLIDGVSSARTAPTAAEYSSIEKRLQQEMGRMPTKTEVEDSRFATGLKTELNDSLNQLIYLMLPQQSMRKMFINRKAIQGASADMLRVFAHTAVHSAYQQARFKYSEPFINNINNARGYIRDIPNPDKQAVYMDYVQEVENRTKNVLGIEDKSVAAQIAGSITNSVFFFVLSAPASALVNILGASAVTMPYIGGRYGYAKTNALMLKNLGRYMATVPTRTLKPIATGHIMQTSFPSIAEGGNLSPLLQRAANRWIEDGDINISMTNDIYDLGERPSATYTGAANVFKKILAGPFHQAERAIREVVLFTTFELAHEKFLKEPKRDLRGVIERDTNGDPVPRTPDEAFEDAIEEARDIAGMTLGDYVRQMKGRVFTYPGVNIIMQFKQYAIQSAFILLRNHYLAIARPFSSSEIKDFRQQLETSGMPPNIIEQRVQEADRYRKELGNESYRRLAGILGMTFLYGGIVAQPYFSVGLGTLIKMFAPDDDDEFFDWENWFANYMNTTVGGAAGAIFNKMGMETAKSKEAGRKLAEAVTYGPVSALTGSALSDRVSLDMKNLWYREGRYDNDARQSVTNEIISNLGPGVGLGLNWVDAYQLVEDGQYGRAYEKAVPAIFAKPVTAYRIGQEGATTRGGDIIGGLYPNEFDLWDISMQSIGLQPLKLYKGQKSAIQAKTYQQKVLDKHNSILNRLWMERGTPAYVDALDKAREFTLKYPDMPIDSDAIDNAFDARSEAQAQANAMGARLDEKLMTKTLPMLNYGALPPKVEIRGAGNIPK